VWTAHRSAQSLTFLPDGRIVQIGGRHENCCDPCFTSYNDVFVHEPDGSFAIYGYPESVFPPTDAHTATRIGMHVYVIGSLEPHESRRDGETPVYRLDLCTWQMDRLDTRGDAPGRIYEHRARPEHSETCPCGIRVWGGTVATGDRGSWQSEPNLDVFVLDLDHLIWRRDRPATAIR
jgi:hypothetical protein